MKKAIVIIMLLVCMSLPVFALERIQIINFRFSSFDINPLQASVGPSFYSSNYLTDPDVSVEGNGNSNIAFLEEMYGPQIKMRNREIPAVSKINRVLQKSCGTSPTYSQVIVTDRTDTRFCYTNEDRTESVIRIWLLDGKVNYAGEKSLFPSQKQCFDVVPDSIYLVDIVKCKVSDCVCTDLEPQDCVLVDDQVKMRQTRDCTPARCEDTEVLSEWIDLSVGNCEMISGRACIESDLGRDYTHFGTTKVGTTSFNDRCVSDEIVKEYYCDDKKIRSVEQYCESNEVCKGGRCIPKAAKDCGYVDGSFRREGAEWCIGETLKTCSDGIIDLSSSDESCKYDSCNFNGQIIPKGEAYCMSDGLTIIECDNPDITEPFKFSTCASGKECQKNSLDTKCEEVEREQSSVMSKMWTILDLIQKISKRD